MSHDDDKLASALVAEFVIANSDWPKTDKEIDALLEDEAESDPYSESERAAHVRAVLKACGEGPVHAEGEQLVLFDTDSDGGATRARPRDLFEIVRLAYREVHEGWSSDRLVADPEMDARFIQACWRFGAKASQFDLNHLLINARKRKIIGKTEGAKKYRVDPTAMDKYWLASEFAARIIQDREFLEHHRRITVDRILCDPRLSGEFDDFARMISPGHSSLDYRWAALAIRKARSRLTGQCIGVNAFQWLGRLDGIRASQISQMEGFLWVRVGSAHIYIGHGQNLRAQAERILQIRIERIISEFPLFHGVAKEPFELGIAEKPRSKGLSRHPNILVRDFKPCLNVLTGSLLDSLQKGDCDGEERRACGAA